MGLSLDELERRRAVVGASEVALLFGLPSWKKRTLSDLWWEKKHGIAYPDKGNDSTDLGTKLEPVILADAEERLRERIVDRQKWCVKGSNAATLDGRLEHCGAVIDAKTSGIIGPHHLSEWGESLSDDCPDGYILQLQAQMLVTGAELGYIAALIGGRGFDLFKVYPQPVLMQAIVTKADEFIASLASDVPPDEPPQLDTLKRIRRQPNKVLDRCDEIETLWDQLQVEKTRAKAVNDEVERAQRLLLAKLGDAEAAQTGDGMITYFEQTNRYAAKPASETPFRVLRFKRGA